MMDVREKLVEQLREVASKTPPICRYDNPDEIEHFGKTITVYCKPFEQFQELMRDAADYIAHSVTVQGWIPASEPPKDTCEYWIAYKAGGDYSYSTGYFDGKCWCSALTHHKIPVTHWMPMPQPPKGE